MSSKQSDAELLKFLKDASKSKIQISEPEKKSKEATSTPIEKDKSEFGKGNRPKSQAHPRTPSKPGLTRNQFDEYLAQSPFFKTTLQNITEEIKGRLQAKIDENAAMKILGDERFETAIENLVKEESFSAIDFSTFLKWMGDDLAQEIKITGGPGFYLDNIGDVYRLIKGPMEKYFDPVVQKFLKETEKQYASHKNVGKTFERFLKIVIRILEKQVKSKRKIELSVFARKVIDITVDILKSDISNADPLESPAKDLLKVDTNEPDEEQDEDSLPDEE